MSFGFRGAVIQRSAYRCALAGPECDGPLDAHHIIRQQALKTLDRRGDLTGTLELALCDSRNGIALCRAHHHRVTVGALELERDELPEVVEAFAEEYGCAAELEREYGPSSDPDRPTARPAPRQSGQLRQRLGK